MCAGMRRNQETGVHSGPATLGKSLLGSIYLISTRKNDNSAQLSFWICHLLISDHGSQSALYNVKNLANENYCGSEQQLKLLLF